MASINSTYGWAIEKCDAPDVGYSMSYRAEQTVNGITYYDCSSFVWYGLIAGGFDCVKANNNDSYPFTTHTMDAVLTKLGFSKLPITGEWKAGDIVLADEHTEFVYSGGNGSGITMGAHWDGTALPNQVSINNFTSTSSDYHSLYRYGEGGASGGSSKGYGWSLKAFCAMIGSVAHEGIYNPGQMEGAYGGLPDSGHGLIQWTNANWGDGFNPLIGAATHFNKQWYDGLFQCELIANCDVPEYMNSGTGTQQWGWLGAVEPYTFKEFKESTDDLAKLTRAWYLNVERPSDTDDTFEPRYETAQYWYNKLKDVDPAQFKGLKFEYKVTYQLGVLTDAQIENNVHLMYNLFCGSGTSSDEEATKHKKLIWMILRTRR